MSLIFLRYIVCGEVSVSQHDMVWLLAARAPVTEPSYPMQLHTGAEHFGNVIFRYSELMSKNHTDASIDVKGSG
jgi:hypothetical protein